MILSPMTARSGRLSRWFVVRENLSHHVRNNCGVWYADVMGNLSGLAYQYKVYFDYHTEIARDPYTIATSENGKKSAILSHQDRIFPAFQSEAYEKADWRLDNPCQAVVYEMHVRDLTISPTSGVDEAYRGTYRGAHQTGQRTPKGMPQPLTISRN